MIERTKKTVKQLQAECRKRGIGFMMNWTKAALVKRLEDEDTREKFYERQMASKEKEVSRLLEDMKGRDNQIKNRLKDAEGKLEAEKINEVNIKEKIDGLLNQKVLLSRQWKESKKKIIELELNVKSLI